MTDKKDLIQQAIGLQGEIDRLIIEYRVKEWSSLDLTIAQLKCIAYIYSRGMVNYKELAGGLNVTPSVVTVIVNRLVLQGMVKRRRMGGSTYRRVQCLVVTKRGQALLDNLRRQTSRNMSEILDTMSNEEDLSALVRGFSALIKATEPYLRAQHEVVTTANN